MRVIFVNPQGNFDSKDSRLSSHPDFGGQIVYVKEVAIAMEKMGVNVDIVTRRIEDPLWPEFSSKFDGYHGTNVRIVRIDFGPSEFLPKEKLWPYLGEFAKKMADFYKKEGLDFITTHYGDGGISGAMLSKYLKIPFSFTAHSLGAQKMDKLDVDEKNFSHFDEIYNFSARILAEGISMKYSSFNVVSTRMEQFEQYGHKLYRDYIDVNDKKFKIIPPGVNNRIFNPNRVDDKKIEEKVRSISGTSPLIIISSRLDPKKNHISVVKAYVKSPILRERYDLLIVTNGFEDPYNNKYDNEVIKEIIDFVIKNNLKSKVHFINIENQKDLASLYKVARRNNSFFVSMALYEPFGLAIIEAMACGLPVVATKNGGPTDIIRDGEGLLADPQNLDEIKTQMEKLMDEELYMKISVNGIKRVNTSYTWESTARGYLESIQNAQFEDFDIPSCFYTGRNFPPLFGKKQ
ncbi:MAG: glycosyltransferase family 1 protein [Mesoaciditoga sp.]|uniref:glycosyltransferase n=1 Tax=Athalassotoga sp. TaxID=2022597 RepID=UPI000CBB6199|nr:MAG: glycosyltransferase family 1 protein [Mesoaciditoga sp.]PMP78704.1 MAG: glycosyltransferase family 1 protein [Mesoaciditoga sp.]HEU24301.1 glycosyltransferase family 1 protein [Mesoaciditoga lauensis]